MLYYSGEVALARKCYEKTFGERKQYAGADHVDTATTMNNLACCQSSMGEVDDAGLMLKNAARLFKDLFGAAHPRTCVVQRNLEKTKLCQTRCVVAVGVFLLW